MNLFNVVITFLFILILSGFAYFLLFESDHDINSTNTTNNDTVSELSNINISNYSDYSDVKLATSMDQKKTTILFFAATEWCQTCELLEREIIARQIEIPEGVTILKVDYDNDIEMNRQHGVTAQHTLVVLDENGEEIKRWIGGGFETFLQQLDSI